MKPLFIKKNGTVSKVSGIVMNLIPSYTMAEYNALTHKPLLWIRTDEDYAQIPASDVSYGSGSVEDALDDRLPLVASSDGGAVFTVSRIVVQKYSDSVMRLILYDDDTSHTYRNAICNFSSTTFTPR